MNCIWPEVTLKPEMIAGDGFERVGLVENDRVVFGQDARAVRRRARSLKNRA